MGRPKKNSDDMVRVALLLPREAVARIDAVGVAMSRAITGGLGPVVLARQDVIRSLIARGLAEAEMGERAAGRLEVAEREYGDAEPRRGDGIVAPPASSPPPKLHSPVPPASSIAPVPAAAPQLPPCRPAKRSLGLDEVEDSRELMTQAHGLLETEIAWLEAYPGDYTEKGVPTLRRELSEVKEWLRINGSDKSAKPAFVWLNMGPAKPRATPDANNKAGAVVPLSRATPAVPVPSSLPPPFPSTAKPAWLDLEPSGHPARPGKPRLRELKVEDCKGDAEFGERACALLAAEIDWIMNALVLEDEATATLPDGREVINVRMMHVKRMHREFQAYLAAVAAAGERKAVLPTRWIALDPPEVIAFGEAEGT